MDYGRKMSRFQILYDQNNNPNPKIKFFKMFKKHK